MHLQLLEKLTEKLPDNSTIVFKHIEELGRTTTLVKDTTDFFDVVDSTVYRWLKEVKFKK